MVEFPLLRMPTPEVKQPPRGFGGSSRVKFPDRQKQIQRIGPVFQRLQDVMKRDPLILRRDPAGIAPERALVIEIAGSVDNLYEAIDRVEGLSILSEQEWERAADEDFRVIDTRKDHEGEFRDDKPVGGLLYLAMPDLQALQQLISLWDRYQKGLPFNRGLTPWRNAFKQLRDIRAWGPQDRIPQEMIDYLKAELANQPQNIRLEVELWSYSSIERQSQAFERFQEAVRISGGEIIHHASIQEIAYEAALVDMPASELISLLHRKEVELAICDDVMLIRPQSTISLPTKVSENVTSIRSVEPLFPEEGSPIVGLLDSVPVQGHRLLDDRLVLDDPENLNDLSVVSDRCHGTEMASLIIHGDRNLNELPLRRLIYFRPVLYAPGDGRMERLQQDRLLIDTIYRAVLRMKIGDEEGEATAPDVFIINLSLGDKGRPFTGLISPWGRLLDYLADKFGILFIVSAGNILSDLRIPEFTGTMEWEDITPEERERAILKALGQQRSQRTLLSPSEALNIITVGSWYEDAHTNTQRSHLVFPSYTEEGPNISSAIGLGYRKVIKPDIFMPGGQGHHIVRTSSNEGLSIGVETSIGRFSGLKTAAPDRAGRLDQEGYTSGTSAAAALATRAAHRLFDALVGEDNGMLLVDADPFYYGLVVKALLVHRARWSDKLGSLLNEIYGPKGRGKHVEHRDNIARVLGYGRPIVEEAMSCANNRATLVGYGEITANELSHSFRVPLPSSLDRVTEPRYVTLTLAWFSPVNVRRQVYRRAKLEIRPDNFNDDGIHRIPLQPSDKSVPRGTLSHVHYEGNKAVPFVDDGNMIFQVFCRAQGGYLEQPIKYGLAVTIEAGEHISVYQQIKDRLAPQVQTSG